MRVSLRAVLAMAAASVPLALASVVAGQASAAARPVATLPAATTYSATGGLSGVAAASDSSAWAVGYVGNNGTGKILMLHWNGRAWSRVTSPKDAWAVGDTGNYADPHTLILHWNGKAWSAVTSPAPVADGSLSAVTATAKGGWAVGYHSTGSAAIDTSPVIFKLTGTKWSRVDPAFGKDSGVALDGVAVTSAGTTFATGLYTGMITGVLARWNGSSWGWVSKFPEEGTYHWLNAIAAGPHGTAFALGINTASAPVGVISIEWTGHSWVKAPAPSSASPHAIALAPGGTVWAAGSYGVGNHSLVMRWTGKAWSRVASPAKVEQLNGLAFAAKNYGWAVGVTNPDTGSTKTVIVHWNGRSWS